MPLTKLMLIPNNTSYNVSKGVSTLGAKLDGGFARYRRDILNPSSQVDCVFVLTPDEYEYLEAFFASISIYGSAPFLTTLIVDSPSLKDYESYLIPGSFKLTGQKGLTYYVSCSFEIKPLPLADSVNLDIVFMFNTFGPEWKTYEDIFNTLINVEMANDF